MCTKKREAFMGNVQWSIKGREFVHCNCAYGCPCQFNGLPTHGKCEAVLGVQIREGNHGATRLDGLNIAAVVAWPAAIHQGKGRIVPIVDERATGPQREALLRIMSGQDTEPGATFFQVFSTTYEKVFDPVFAKIDFTVDIESRKAQIKIPGLIDGRGEPIVNAVTGQEHRARINLPNGFEYTTAEVGRGWTKTSGPIELNLQDSHAQFAELHMTQSGVVR
jgi:hypothetical protein